MKPFSSVQSHNFKFLLFVARAIATAALVFLIGAIGFAIWFAIIDRVSMAMASIPFLIWSISLFVFAGIVALLVSIEEHLRMQEVRDVRNGRR